MDFLDIDGGAGIGDQVDAPRSRAFGEEIRRHPVAAMLYVGRYRVAVIAADRDVAADLGAIVHCELVVAVAAVQAVGASAADDGVAAVAAVDPVIAPGSEQQVAIVGVTAVAAGDDISDRFRCR